MKNVIPKTLELRASPQDPVTQLAVITGSRDRMKDPVQFGLVKVKPMDSFKLNEFVREKRPTNCEFGRWGF